MPRFSHALTVLILILGLGASIAKAESAFGSPWPLSAAETVPAEGELWGELENGLRYVIIPATEHGNEVNLRLVVAAGRANEPAGMAGLSYLLADLMFEGTRHVSGEDLTLLQLANGMGLRGSGQYVVDMNHTVYRLDLLEPQEGALETGIQFFGEIVGSPVFDGDSIEVLKGSIEHQASYGLGKFLPAEAVLADTLMRSELYQQFGDSRVESEVGNIQIPDLQTYHGNWYGPERMTLIVTGAVDSESAFGLIQSHFGALERGGRSEAIASTSGRIRDKGEIYSRETTGAFGRLTVANTVEMRDRFDLEIERRLYVLDFLGRYAERLAADSDQFGGASLSVLGDYVTLLIERKGPFIQMLDYLSQTDKAVHRLERYGIRKEDLAEAKQSYLELRDTYDLTLSSKNYPRILADRLVQSVTKKIPFRRGEALGSFVQQVLDTLDVEQVKALCEEVFRTKNLSYLVELPQGFGIKSKTIEKRLKGMRKSYDFTWERAGELDQDYQIGSGFETSGMVKSTKLIEFGKYPVLQYEFANNVRLNLVRATAFPGRIQMHLAMGNGMTDLANANPAFPVFVRSLVLKMKVGTGVHAPTMREMFKSKGLRYTDVGIDVGQTYWSAEASSEEEIGAFLSGMLVWLVTSQLSEEDFDDEKERILESLEKGAGSSGLKTLDTLLWEEEDRLKHYFTSEDVEAISFTDLEAWLKAVREKSYVELTVVGDANPRSLLRDVRKSFGSAPVRTGKVMQPRHARKAKWGEPGIITETEKMSYPNGYVTLLFPVVEDGKCENRYRQEVYRLLMLEHGRRMLADAPVFGETFEVTVEGTEMVPGSEALKVQLRCAPDEAEEAEKRLADIISAFPDSFDERLLQAAERNVWIDLRWSTKNLGALVELFNQSQGRPNALACSMEIFEKGLSGKLDTYREVAREQFSSGNVRGVALMPEN